MTRIGWFGAGIAAVLLGSSGGQAHADGESCRVVDVEFTPADLAGQQPMNTAPQIVVWVTDAAGVYYDTIFITEAVGRYGIGNRPGRYDFNSGPKWPYGRRETVFPVWGHAHGVEFPRVEFQDGIDTNLSHNMSQSSPDLHFCAPKLRSDPSWDAGTCASQGYTDKGKLSLTATSNYPPRSDLALMPEDTSDVQMFEAMNVFDAVSRATPAEGIDAKVSWMLPTDLPGGNYILWMEVAREFDHNASYSEAQYPSPTDISYGHYGEAYRGQPSVVYRVPFVIGPTDATATTLDYTGYSDPDGLDGDLRAPDATISAGVAGSGAERLAVRADGGTPYRVKVVARTEPDMLAPSAPSAIETLDVTSRSATIQWAAPGEDGLDGRASRYEIRYMAGGSITEANFAAGLEVAQVPVPDEPGLLQSLELTNLLFDTEYSIGIRAIDDCSKAGPLTVLTFRTAERQIGEVDACFIATAAYGSVLAADVSMLRRFRDAALRNTVLGQLAIQSYYTFGPTLSGVIAESDPLRDTVRELLAPVVERVRDYTY